MSTFTKDLGKSLFTAFIGASVTVIMPLLLICFIHKSAVINVGELIQTNGKIALSVTISNFNNQIINDMEIYFPDDINLLNIQSIVAQLSRQKNRSRIMNHI